MTHYTPNLPALITALPSDHARAPHTEFTRARQVLFLENLSVTGSVRSAASAAGTSHQSAYRARRACASFRTAWDAALVVARAAAADTLACRAIDGVEEKVFYHGEEVGSRTRYSDRLLLAHLARLDRQAETPVAAAFAEDFDAALAGFGRGEAFVVAEPSHEVPACAGTEHRSPAQAGVSGGARDGDFSSSGPCNTRSMSLAAGAAAGPGSGAGAEPGEGDAVRAHAWDDQGYDDDDEDRLDPADYADLFEGESRREARMPVFDRLYAAMARRRPAHAPAIPNRWGSALEDEQLHAFMARLDDWWLVVPPGPSDPPGEWCFHAPDQPGA